MHCAHLKKCQTMTRQFTQDIIRKSTQDWTPCETCPMREGVRNSERGRSQPAFLRKTVVKCTQA